MAPEVIVTSADSLLDDVVGRLRASGLGDDEELTFAFARITNEDDVVQFECFHARPVLPFEFEGRSSAHLELSDAGRTSIMREASQFGPKVSLVEFHSHTFPSPACFSPSDWRGFAEFVPYTWWRLRAQPYAAVVVAPTSIDGVAWLRNPDDAVPVAALRDRRQTLTCTGHSLREKDWFR